MPLLSATARPLLPGARPANADEPSHSVHRKLVLPHLTPKVVALLEETLREWAVELIDPLVDEGGGDFVHRVANPLPTRAMALVVGLPLKDVDRLLDWAMTGTEIPAPLSHPRPGTVPNQRHRRVAPPGTLKSPPSNPTRYLPKFRVIRRGKFAASFAYPRSVSGLVVAQLAQGALCFAIRNQTPTMAREARNPDSVRGARS